MNQENPNNLTKPLAITIIANLVLTILIVFAVIGTYQFWSPFIYTNLDSHTRNQFSEIFEDNGQKVKVISEESAIIEAVDKANPAVVSIIVSKDLPKLERYYEDYSPFGDSFFDDFFGGSGLNFQIPRYRQNGTEEKEIGGGSGFIVSSDGMIVTNKHVVDDEEAKYTVLMNDGQKIEAEVLARDSVNDIAILKIDKKDLSVIELADSDNLKVGQTVIAIGNALGEYRNTVSTGVVSGLQRDITAGDSLGQSEDLSGVIQTDAAINPGNSGGPLLNIAGQAIGVNVAVAYGTENIGFALPINSIKSVIDSVKEHGRIIRPMLGVRYVMINQNIIKKNNLDVDYGALVLRGEEPGDLAVIPGGSADKAGIVENDIILEVNGQKIEGKNTLSSLVAKYNVGDQITLKIMHRGEEKEVRVRLEERKN